MTLGPSDLILPHYSLPAASFAERCATAVAGGFAAIGIHTSVHAAARAGGMTDTDIVKTVHDGGVPIAQLEAAVPLGPPEGAEAFTAEVEHCLALAELFGADHVHVVVAGDPDDQVRRFAAACDRAAPQGVRMAVEFIPTVARLEDAASTLAFVEARGARQCRPRDRRVPPLPREQRLGEARVAPGDRVVSIQFDDAAVPPVSADYITDTMHHRLAPGEGDFDLVRFVQTMAAVGARAPYSVEVLSDDLAALAPEEVGCRLGDATRRVLERARA